MALGAPQRCAIVSVSTWFLTTVVDSMEITPVLIIEIKLFNSVLCCPYMVKLYGQRLVEG